MGQHLTVTNNDRQVQNINLDEAYRDNPQYGGLDRSRGFIGLEDHGNGRVEFRNVRIRELESSAAAVPIPTDAQPFRGHSYRYFAEDLPWDEAKRRCEDMGGHLAIVENAAENDFLTELARRSFVALGLTGQEAVWLGGTDEAVEGEWKWVNGSRFDYTNWRATQPNNKQGRENYLILMAAHPNSPPGTWSDQPRESSQFVVHFICEWDGLAGRDSGAGRE